MISFMSYHLVCSNEMRIYQAKSNSWESNDSIVGFCEGHTNLYFGEMKWKTSQ